MWYSQPPAAGGDTTVLLVQQATLEVILLAVTVSLPAPLTMHILLTLATISRLVGECCPVGTMRRLWPGPTL